LYALIFRECVIEMAVSGGSTGNGSASDITLVNWITLGVVTCSGILIAFAGSQLRRAPDSSSAMNKKNNVGTPQNTSDSAFSAVSNAMSISDDASIEEIAEAYEKLRDSLPSTYNDLFYLFLLLFI